MATFNVSVTKNSIYEFTVEAATADEAVAKAAETNLSDKTPITSTAVNAYQQ
jgi:hypothetical protein